MLFSQVVGQQRSKTGFFEMAKTVRLPHAILLVGESTLPLALAMAQYLLCKNPLPKEACGTCASCIKMKTQEHPDLILSYPTISPKPNVKASSAYYAKEFKAFVKQTPYNNVFDWLQFINAENKQGNITAEECRELIEKLNLKSYEGGKKVLVLWQPEYLGKEGNILLKVIEEPPADTIIIMAATNTEDILATILSRTQLIRLSPLTASDIAEALVQQHHTDPRRAAQCAQLSNGSFDKALKLLQHDEDEIFPEIRNWFNHLFTNNGIGISSFVEKLGKKGREQQRNFLSLVGKLLQHTLQARYAPHIRLDVAGDEEAFVKKLASMNVSLDALEKMIQEIEKTSYCIERNAHSKTQLHALSIKLQYLIKQKPLALSHP